MLGRNRGMAAAVVALGMLASCAWASHAWAQGPAIEPEATRLLKRMTDYLGGLERFSLDTDNMLEDVLVSGQKIQYGFSPSVSVRRPDRLRAARTGDVRPHSVENLASALVGVEAIVEERPQETAAL